MKRFRPQEGFASIGHLDRRGESFNLARSSSKPPESTTLELALESLRRGSEVGQSPACSERRARAFGPRPLPIRLARHEHELEFCPRA